MKLALITTAAVAAAAAALAASPLASAGPEEDFLKYISENGISWPSGKTQAVIDTGYAVCQDWKNGATFAQEVADLQEAADWTENQAGVFIGAATGAFCPQYESKIR